MFLFGLLLAGAVVIIYLFRFRSYLVVEQRFRLMIILLVSLSLAYILIQPAIAHSVTRMTPGIDGALWLSNLGSMTSSSYALKLFNYLYYGKKPSRTHWIHLLYIASLIITTLALMVAGPHVTIFGALPASALSSQRIALVVDRVTFSGFLATMVLLLARVHWRQLQQTADRIGRSSLFLFLLGAILAVPYLVTAIWLGFSGPSDQLIHINTVALNSLSCCYFLGALLPMVILQPERIAHNSRLLAVAIRLYPVWHDMTQRVSGVKYTAISWQTCWRDPAQTTLLVRRYTIESCNAAQVLLGEMAMPRAAAIQHLPLHYGARADAACYAAFAGYHEPDTATRVLLGGYPYLDRRDITAAIQYLELVAHYYVTTGAPARRYRWWSALERLLGGRSLYRPLSLDMEMAR